MDLAMEMKVEKTRIINEATQPVLIKGGQTGDHCLFNRLLPQEECTLEFFLNDNNVQNSFRFEVGGTAIPVSPDDGRDYLFRSNDLAGAKEITIHDAPEWRIIKKREKPHEYQHMADFATYSTTVREDASSRIQTLQTSCASLRNLIKLVQICPAQCDNLFQTCMTGIAEMAELYDAVSKNDNYMWRLFTSKKLRLLVSSLDRLISTLKGIEDLLKACGNQWCRMGLVVSANSLPCFEKKIKASTKFDLVLKQLRWNLDTIHYVLDLAEDVQLNWNEEKCRYVLERKQGTGFGGEGGLEIAESGTDLGEARNDLLFHIKDINILRREIFCFIWILFFAILAAFGDHLFGISHGSFLVSYNFLLFFLGNFYYILIRSCGSFRIENIGVVGSGNSIGYRYKRRRNVKDGVDAASFVCGAVHLIYHCKNGLLQINIGSLHMWKDVFKIPSKEKFLLQAICFILLLRAVEPLANFLENFMRKCFPQYGNERYFEEDVLKDRLKYFGEINNSTKCSVPPISFEIDHEQLHTETLITGNPRRKIYSGYWHGLEVVIAMTENRESCEENKKYESQKIQEEIKSIAALMLRLQHPNVVDFFGYSFKPHKSPNSGGSDDKSVAAGYIVMERMQSDLWDLIERLVLKQAGRPFNDDVTIDILLQIVGAMRHVHDSGVLYRDLKAKNCVVSERSSLQSSSQVKFYTVKLIDFEISKELDQYATDHTLMRGTTRWMAPEVWGIGVYVPGAFGQKAPYGTAVDVYSFGITCYEVITGSLPFRKYRRNSEIELALKNKERPEFLPGMSCPKALMELMSRCWVEDPSARPNFKEIEKELWTIKYDLEVAQT